MSLRSCIHVCLDVVWLRKASACGLASNADMILLLLECLILTSNYYPLEAWAIARLILGGVFQKKPQLGSHPIKKFKGGKTSRGQPALGSTKHVPRTLTGQDLCKIIIIIGDLLTDRWRVHTLKHPRGTTPAKIFGEGGLEARIFHEVDASGFAWAPSTALPAALGPSM